MMETVDLSTKRTADLESNFNDVHTESRLAVAPWFVDGTDRNGFGERPINGQGG